MDTLIEWLNMEVPWPIAISIMSAIIKIALLVAKVIDDKYPQR